MLEGKYEYAAIIVPQIIPVSNLFFSPLSNLTITNLSISRAAAEAEASSTAAAGATAGAAAVAVDLGFYDALKISGH